MRAPSDAEIAEVDAGVNDRLAGLAAEPRDPDPVLADRQDARDRAAYRGDFVGAEAEHARYLDALMARELGEREPV